MHGDLRKGNLITIAQECNLKEKITTPLRRAFNLGENDAERRDFLYRFTNFTRNNDNFRICTYVQYLLKS